MAKGNDGNYLQHSIETEAAIHLVREGAERNRFPDPRSREMNVLFREGFERDPKKIKSADTRRRSGNRSGGIDG